MEAVNPSDPTEGARTRAGEACGSGPMRHRAPCREGHSTSLVLGTMPGTMAGRAPQARGRGQS